MDRIDQIVTEHLEGLVVRKDLADKFRGRFSVPTYVGEFLIGKYCATSDEEEIQEGLEQVERLLSRRVVRTGDHELFKARAREQGTVQIIDIIRAKLDARRDEYVAELPSLQINDALIAAQLVIDNDRMLTGGFYAQLSLSYVPGQERPFVVTEVRPIQAHARAGLDRLSEARELLSTLEWKDFLLRSVGLEPEALAQDAQDAYFLRMVPFVVRNYNMVELGPRGTGKSHLFQQVSPYAYLLSGGQTTVAQLFVNNASGQRGLVTQHDVVAFDEIAGIRFKDRDGINVMKGYMASGEFARGKESIRAEGGMAFLGNFQVDVAHQLRRGHLLSPMPEAMRDDTAFMDRLHAYVPGWDIPAMGREQMTHHYGLVSDLLAQWWHELRSENRYVRVRDRVSTNDSWRGRDAEAVEKTVDGLLKLLNPDPEAQVTGEDLAWAMNLATVARRRVKEAQASIGAEEFGDVDLGYSVDGGSLSIPECPESVWRRHDIDDDFPSLGPVAVPASTGLPATLPDPLPPGFPLVGFGVVIDQPCGAQGAFGTVYRVKRDFDGRILAGKLFRKDPSAPYPEMADQALRQEVKALESLTHPNIVRVLGPIPVTTQGEWMIISEWIDGSTLDDFTDGPKAMDGNEIFRTGTQLFAALTYLEDIGVVHRDIKPANVMVDYAGSLKLIDFNLTRDTGRNTMVAGTPAYMPPDFLAQASSTDSFVDRYGVAVILYQLIVGQHPYAACLSGGNRPGLSTPPTDPRTLRPELSSKLASFLVQSVAPRDADRFRSSHEMAEGWATLIDDVTVLA
ncbi:BREX system Lon protease-like protein BrxL [Mycolicibacterium austroafricanum]|uniref:BREX system Lon protease-like protein BrxL n=1 Tax=Mycolicibacterium austroafricanum TaxID=39687 RepID=UPI001CA327E3|nr:BREX system Lon protease-like protein BrxL [Mycolicibacterium austroafricanum]QZT60283.1 BREX system Lon protease-like protein BrxL [Mycolicibacterium austroafricanum]